jgi:hypothetical protein
LSIDLGIQNLVTSINPKTGAKTIDPARIDRWPRSPCSAGCPLTGQVLESLARPRGCSDYSYPKATSFGGTDSLNQKDSYGRHNSCDTGKTAKSQRIFAGPQGR